MPTSDWTLYVKTNCPWCVEATAWLREHGYDFNEVDVLRDPEEFEHLAKISGQRYTPTLVLEERDLLLADFDVDQLEEFLTKNGLLKAEPVAARQRRLRPLE